MAESKKKATAKKAVKKTSKKVLKEANKKAAATTAKKTSKKAVKKSAVKKAQETTHKKVTHVSEKVKKDTNSTWKLASAIMGIVLVVLLIFVGIYYLAGSAKLDSTSGVDSNVADSQTGTQSSGNGVKLLIVEDPNCPNCDVDLFVSQVQQNLIPDMQVEKVSIEDERGMSLVTAMNAQQVPVYLFSEEIAQRDDWNELSQAFIKRDVDGSTYYLLNPQFVPNKVLIEEPVVSENAVVYGDENAPVTIIEFSDYECPFCAIAEGNEMLVEQFRAQAPEYVAPMPSIYEEYVATGKVKVVFYNMPIASLHPQAEVAHLAALCANEQDMWKEFHEKLFNSRSDWIESSDKAGQFKSYASELGLDTTSFNECLDSEKYSEQIENEIALAASYGVSGTPAFFIGKNFISGAQDYQTFKAIIDSQLE